MLWHKLRGSPQSETSLPKADLRRILGDSGRLHFAEGAAGSHMTSVPCSVVKVDRNQILLELPNTTMMPQPESAVILEVAQQTAMLQCFTTVREKGPGPRVTLRTPGRPHVLQRRRFPRIDLFIGITLQTPDRPVEQVPAQMINLSLEGAACVLVEPVSPGSALTLNLAAIGLHPAEARASVIRCTPTPSHLWVVGVKFQGLQSEQELYLGKYISDVTQSHTP